ncbi:histidine phosphatase family protein [Roseiconus lacunae]|uniref:Histidine phosphatase family protein n=2 Tax=Roseiconus lacunae TaxID=2605694 RepID=A0ABT7PQE3_9BACT|nr:histidine phosphatase family protein [Roseiconus lacunae]MDM4018735.1 histidine phosphatase family protein [Roseiconus lacunae]WRQ48570.1 histidine phosphatase family protein [Stieleria sp. HD01]
MSRTATMTRVLLIRPGATDFDEQGRMKGCLDMPLSSRGEQQVDALAEDLAHVDLRTIYYAPCESAAETARCLSRRLTQQGCEAKVKMIEAFRNLDHGLWHGKLIDEVRRNHPRVYRLGVEHPEVFCPPGGEPLGDARTRVSKAIRKCTKKARDGVIGLIIPEPLASVAENILNGEELKSLWKHETDSASWTMIETEV